jgi:glutathione peroxidase
MSMYRKTLMAGIATMAIVSSYGDGQLSPTSSVHATEPTATEVPKVLSFKVKTLEGEAADLSKYAGKVVVFVNVASKCGMTPQYTALQELHEKYKDKGLVIVGVPCNQFLGQEPGTGKEIRDFCTSKYKVTFDLLEKANVKDEGKEKACELFAYLTEQDTKPAGKGPVGWNFEKFVVDRKGNVVGRFKSNVKPESKEMVGVIEKALAE